MMIISGKRFALISSDRFGGAGFVFKDVEAKVLDCYGNIS